MHASVQDANLQNGVAANGTRPFIDHLLAALNVLDDELTALLIRVNRAENLFHLSATRLEGINGDNFVSYPAGRVQVGKHI